MPERPQVEALGEHRYLVHVREGEDLVEFAVDASPDMIVRLAGGARDATAGPAEVEEAGERRVVEAAVTYLVARQHADDLPAQLDLEDVAAAYEGFEDDLRRRLADEQSEVRRHG